MGQYTSYYLYERYERRCSNGDCSDWIPSYPNEYSKDGNETMPLVVRNEQDADCGWQCEPEYQWVDVPIEDDYICDECELDIEFRWISTSAYTYFGDYRYEILQEQFRKDGGEWQDTDNTKYANPVKVGKKMKMTMDNGDVFSQSCGTDDGVWHSYNNSDYIAFSDKLFQHTTNLTSDGMPVLIGDLTDVPYNTAFWRNGYDYVDKIEFGDCVTELGWRYRNTPSNSCDGDPKCIEPDGKKGCGASYWDNDESTSGERMRNTNVASFADIGLKEIIFPEGLRWIGGGQIFAGNKLTALTIPSSVESIGYLRAFDQTNPGSGCISWSSSGAFANNKFLRNVALNEGLKSIGQGDFSCCTSLERIDLPSTLEKMGDGVFSGCRNLKQIVFKGEEPPTKNCTEDSQYFDNQCRYSSGSDLSANTDTYIYIPCGSLSAYTDFLSDIPSDRIVEYGGSCGDIPSIDSMYNVLFTYKVGTATTAVYRGAYNTASTNYITSSEDFSDVIDGYAAEITIPTNTEIIGIIDTPDCGKLTLYGRLIGYTSNPTNLYSNAKEFVISTSDVSVTIYGGDNTEKVTISSGCSPVIWGSFADLEHLTEVNIDGNPTLRGNAFAGCHLLTDINITYTGSVIDVLSASTSNVLSGSYPVIHVPCELYDAYTTHVFWKKFTIVKDTDECQQTP